MPSSGSTTSRIASSRSARNSSLGTAVSLIWRLLTGLRHCVLEGHPTQQRTLDPRRILGHPGEGDTVAEHIFVARHIAAGRNHLVECRYRLQRITDVLADHQVGEYRRRSLADRAALTVIGHIGDVFPVVGECNPQRHFVAARRIDMADFGAERLAQPAMMRMLVMVQDHLLVHLLHSHGETQSLPKNRMARCTPATSRSTSSSVLYTANDARAVAAIPNLRCSGHAQW